MTRTVRSGATCLPLIVCAVAALAGAAVQTPQSIADDLLAADRAFAGAASDRNVVDALAAMFRDDVTMAVPGGFATGREEVLAALRGNPDNLASRADWTPLRAGISADGAHGFTFGLMTLRNTDGAERRAKYMSYRIRTDGAWRVAVYKRAPAPGGGPTTLMPPSLPAALVPTSTDGARIDAFRDSLKHAEQAFSDEAQKIGLGPAFAKYGHADAVNMGAPAQPGYTVGAAAIGADIGAGSPGPGSPVSWSADRVIVASSGDLGITLGFIRSNDPAAKRPPSPFFTIWRRASPSDPWRYVAE